MVDGLVVINEFDAFLYLLDRRNDGNIYVKDIDIYRLFQAENNISGPLVATDAHKGMSSITSGELMQPGFNRADKVPMTFIHLPSFHVLEFIDIQVTGIDNHHF